MLTRRTVHLLALASHNPLIDINSLKKLRVSVAGNLQPLIVVFPEDDPQKNRSKEDLYLPTVEGYSLIHFEHQDMKTGEVLSTSPQEAFEGMKPKFDTLTNRNYPLRRYA